MSTTHLNSRSDLGSASQSGSLGALEDRKLEYDSCCPSSDLNLEQHDRSTWAPPVVKNCKFD